MEGRRFLAEQIAGVLTLVLIFVVVTIGVAAIG